MKIIKRTRPEEWFVYKDAKDLIYLVVPVDEDDILEKCLEFKFKKFFPSGVYMNVGGSIGLNEFKDLVLVGKLGITHEIKENKLIEIKRHDVCVDDVFETDRGKVFVIAKEYNIDQDYNVIFSTGEIEICFGKKFILNQCKRIGNLAWSHEIVAG